MKKQKYYINLTDQERSEILSSLLIKKNKLTHQGKFTDGIDEVICKLMKARTKLFKVKIVCLSIRNCIKRAPKSTVPGQHRFGF